MQLDDLRRVANQRGWDVVGIFVDEGVSGTIAQRPELDRMMAAASRGEFDILAVWRFDRFARSTNHLLTALERFRALGIDFVSVREQVDTSTPVGRMVFTLMAGIAEFEAALIRERVQAGVDRARERGVKLGRPRVELDVRPALQMLDAGHGLKETARALGVNRNTLRRRLREADLWPRPLGSESTPA